MPVQIEIDEDVFSELQKLATPLIDTPNTVIRRLLLGRGTIDREEHAEMPVLMGNQRRRQQVTPQREFRSVIREILLEAGGGCDMADLLPVLEERMRARLMPDDYVAVSTGEVRWRNAARWERSQMVKEGLLRSDSPAGWWELTDDGKGS